MLIAMIIHASETVPLPRVVQSYKTLDLCRQELIRIAEDPRQQKVISKVFGYTVISKNEKVSTVGFCVKDTRSI
tara:strand:+ start:451 stop:672 length:222 start_codon:yes stop_codon:yes gene_type:complete